MIIKHTATNSRPPWGEQAVFFVIFFYNHKTRSNYSRPPWGEQQATLEVKPDDDLMRF